MPGTRQAQITYAMFTLNESDDEKLISPETLISKLKEAEPTIDYVSFQLEQGEAKARNHYQGVFHMGSRRVASTLKSKFTGVGLGRLHFERARNWLACTEYVSKLRSRIGGPWHAGTPPNENGSNFKRRCPQSEYPPRPDPQARREVTIITGPPGCGKTYEVRNFAAKSGLAVYTVPDRAKQSAARWLGKYAGEPVVLFDEFKFSDFAVNTWKLLLDSYDINVTSSMGGNTCFWQPSYIFLITNDDTEVSKFQQNEALLRRITSVKNYYNWAPPYSKPEPHAIQTTIQETEIDETPPWPEGPDEESS